MWNRCNFALCSCIAKFICNVFHKKDNLLKFAVCIHLQNAKRKRNVMRQFQNTDFISFAFDLLYSFCHSCWFTRVIELMWYVNSASVFREVFYHAENVRDISLGRVARMVRYSIAQHLFAPWSNKNIRYRLTRHTKRLLSAIHYCRTKPTITNMWRSSFNSIALNYTYFALLAAQATCADVCMICIW